MAKEKSHFNEWSSLSEPEQGVITYSVDAIEQTVFPWQRSPGQGGGEGSVGKREGEAKREFIFGALFCNRV